MAAAQHHLIPASNESQLAKEEPLKLYIIPTDDTEKKRLELQHSVIVRQFGWHLHPSIRVKPTDDVLDVATGTGIWALEFAAQFPPTIQIEACDINPVYFPSPSLIPQNVHFSLQSVLALPQEWTNKFDIVHQRLLICGLSQANWRTALQELYRVTKPGGWIQLIEIDPRAVHANHGSATKRFLVWLKALMDHTQLVFDATDHVLSHIRSAGFVNFFQERKVFEVPGNGVAREEGAFKGDLESDTLSCALVYFRVMRPRILEMGLCGEEEFDEVVQGVKEEWERDGMAYDWFVYCAQKPE